MYRAKEEYNMLSFDLRFTSLLQCVAEFHYHHLLQGARIEFKILQKKMMKNKDEDLKYFCSKNINNKIYLTF